VSTASTGPPVLGVDGWKGAWVAARVAGRGVTAVVTWRHGRFADLLDPDLSVVAVDIPVGLAPAGRRGCDLAARAALGPAASRVFLVPPRYALEAATHAEANVLLRAAGEPAISAQTWGLRAAILEVDASSEDRRVVEVHPEVSLVHLAGRVLAPKKTARGVAERLDASRHGSTWVRPCARHPRVSRSTTPSTRWSPPGRRSGSRPAKQRRTRSRTRAPAIAAAPSSSAPDDSFDLVGTTVHLVASCVNQD
jgi:predicted RNase H-like nuclease